MARTAHDRPRLRRSWFAILWTCLWGGVTLALLFVAIAYWTGLFFTEFRQNAVDAAAGAVFVALITGAIASAGLFMLRSARRVEVEAVRPGIAISLEPRKRNRLPRAKSSARQPMVDLAEAEVGLGELLRQLGELPDGPAVPYHVIEHAWYTASNTADQLRAVAARLEAVELAMRHAPPREWAALEEGAGTLRLHLDQGLDAYRTLIGAAGRVVLAGAPVGASTELVEATEGLAGLAEALQELATPKE
jgi:hypothetical protein